LLPGGARGRFLEKEKGSMRRIAIPVGSASELHVVIANDTGISHIAAAVKAPSVIVASHPCALGVSPAQVIREALSLVECVA
jgi:ADP-heptose:LPS heptosyltransferase